MWRTCRTSPKYLQRRLHLAFLTKSNNAYVVLMVSIDGFRIAAFRCAMPLAVSSAGTFCSRTSIGEKRFEENLRRSEAFLKEAQRLSETGSFLWSPGTDEISWSNELYRMFELDEGDITLDRSQVTRSRG